MNTLKFFIATLLVAFAMVTSCSNTTQDNTQPMLSAGENEKIVVYYFHTNYRCKTCRTVERVSEEAIKALKDNQIVFLGVNLDESKGKEIGKKYDIKGQTLLITKGNYKEDVTTEGFLYAVDQPEKLKELLQTKVKALK